VPAPAAPLFIAADLLVAARSATGTDSVIAGRLPEFGAMTFARA